MPANSSLLSERGVCCVYLRECVQTHGLLVEHDSEHETKAVCSQHAVSYTHLTLPTIYSV